MKNVAKCDTWCELQNPANIGVVIRNEFGEVMATLSEKIVLPSSMETLESLVARRAAVFAIEHSLQQIRR